MSAKILVNRINISNKLNRVLTQKSYQQLAFRNARVRFDEAERQALAEFDQHVITQEIQAGPKAENSVLGYGNLSAFLSIKDGEAVIAKIRNELDTGFQIDDTPTFRQTKDGLVYSFKVSAPSLQDIYDANPTPTNFSSRSIPEIIEKGIGNFAYFVFRLAGLPNSVSGTGLQRRTKRKWIDVPNDSPKIKWISEVLDTFRSYFKSR